MKKQNPAKLSIITVNFGSSDKVINLYNSILKNPPNLAWEMIIVDNPTKKGSDGELLAENFAGNSQIHVIQLAENLGYGEGNNEGVKFAKGEFLAICNPDTEVLENTFDKLLDALKSRENIGIAVPILKTGENILENCREFPSIISLIKRRLFKKVPFTSPHPNPLPEGEGVFCDWAQGSFWVMKKEVYDKFAGFDSRFFLFMEDIDFCRRLKREGLKIVQIPDAIAIHSPNRLSGGFIGSAIFRKTFWIHLSSAAKYFWKWRSRKS